MGKQWTAPTNQGKITSWVRRACPFGNVRIASQCKESRADKNARPTSVMRQIKDCKVKRDKEK